MPIKMNEIISTITLTLVYFNGCPNGDATKQEVMKYVQSIDDERIEVHIVIQPAPGSGESYHYNGEPVDVENLPDWAIHAPSPSVFIDGKNVIGETDSEGQTCSVAIPTIKEIKKAVKSALKDS